jgi:4-diphosphocytidyl-2-C-methyl-D-erythritol kinase
VNYTLDILSLRSDGYHNIASVMQTISLFDTIILTESEGDKITLECDRPEIPNDQRNIAWRAASEILRAAGVSRGLYIQLIKRIPSQAGLGGGSSNAAFTLIGVNELFGLGLTTEQLLKIASSLGSDVPFFIFGGTASARGRGEKITPISDAPSLWFVIVKPETNVSTAQAYRDMDEMINRVSARKTREMEEAIQSGDVQRVVLNMSNDFEQSVMERHLPIALLQDDLLMSRAHTARLCGSGSSVFGVMFSRSEAEECLRLIQLKYPVSFLCRSLTREEAHSQYSKEDE